MACGVSITLGVIGLQRPHDMSGKPVAISDNAPSAAVFAQMHVVADTGERFRVPSVGLNVPLGSLNEVDGTITPPGFTSAYLVRNLGATLANASQGTLFIAMHSVRGGGTGPGNYLINVAAGTASINPGTTIDVGPRTYQVTGSRVESKKQVPRDDGIWSNVPGRLIVLTCLQTPAQTESTENLVVTAELKN